jgi:hypothetical protein
MAAQGQFEALQVCQRLSLSSVFDLTGTFFCCSVVAFQICAIDQEENFFTPATHGRQEFVNPQAFNGGNTFFGQPKPDGSMQLDGCGTYKRFEDSAKSTLNPSSCFVVPPSSVNQPSLYQQSHASHVYQQDTSNSNTFSSLAHRSWDGSFSGSNHQRTSDGSACTQAVSSLSFQPMAVPNFTAQIIESCINSTTSLSSSSFSQSWGKLPSIYI